MLAAWSFIYVALAVSAMSMTLSLSSVTAPVRDWGFRRAFWLGKLLSCPYCASHWFAAILAFALGPVSVMAYIISVFALVALSCLVTGACSQLLHWQQNRVDDLRDELSSATEEVKLLMAQNDELKTTLRSVLGDK